jgi:hypothetical protein
VGVLGGACGFVGDALQFGVAFGLLSGDRVLLERHCAELQVHEPEVGAGLHVGSPHWMLR